MLPSHGPRSPYLLPLPDADTPAQAEDVNLNPATARRRKDFNDRVAELRIDNDLAFRTISRTVAEGIKPPRIAHMRRFWESVENMSQFWDASLDQYYETTETSAEEGEEEGKGAKRLRLGSETNEDFKLVVDGKEIVPFPNDIPADPPQPRKRYKGRRIGAGTDMPDSYRSDTVRAFVEGTIWPFRTSLAPPRVMPIVQFGKLTLPVRQTAAVYQLPNDRTKARQGYLRGPILILQARPELGFEKEDGEPDEEKARLDLMREIGGLLHLAQERRREAQEYVKPGEGQWWTTVPRWGGGPGGEVQNELGNSDIVDLVEGVREASQEDEGKKTSGSRKSKRKEGNAILWKELKAGKGNWDAKTEYAAIGREPESPYDEVRDLITKGARHLAEHGVDFPGVVAQPPRVDCQGYRPQRLLGLSDFRQSSRSTAARPGMVSAEGPAHGMV